MLDLRLHGLRFASVRHKRVTLFILLNSDLHEINSGYHPINHEKEHR